MNEEDFYRQIAAQLGIPVEAVIEVMQQGGGPAAELEAGYNDIIAGQYPGRQPIRQMNPIRGSRGDESLTGQTLPTPPNPGIAPIDRVNQRMGIEPGDTYASTPPSYYQPQSFNLFSTPRKFDTSMDDVPCEKPGQIRYGGMCIDPIKLDIKF